VIDIENSVEDPFKFSRNKRKIQRKKRKFIEEDDNNEKPLSKKPKVLKEKKLFRSYKVRVYPNKIQREKFDQWFGCHRKVYNDCVALFSKVIDKKVTKDLLRSHTIQSTEYMEKNAYLKEIPYDLLDSAIGDYIKAKDSLKSRLKDKSKELLSLYSSKFGFRSKKKMYQETIEMSCRFWGHKTNKKKSSVFSDVFNKGMIKCSKRQELPTKLENGFKLVRDKLGHYFYVIPKEVTIKEKQNGGVIKHGTIGIDLGVRTFATAYDVDGHFLEFGKGDASRIVRLGLHLDKLQSRISKCNKISSKKLQLKLKQAYYRLQAKIKHLIDDMHKKTASWLCNNYNVIVMGDIGTQSISNKKTRKIGSKSVRKMLGLAHGKFKTFIKSKCALFTNTRVDLIDEAYTSKTCSICGVQHLKLGGSKVFKCKHCNYKTDRDLNGARNILLKWLSSYSPILSV